MLRGSFIEQNTGDRVTRIAAASTYTPVRGAVVATDGSGNLIAWSSSLQPAGVLVDDREGLDGQYQVATAGLVWTITPHSGGSWGTQHFRGSDTDIDGVTTIYAIALNA